jgi:VWFA-related protein
MRPLPFLLLTGALAAGSLHAQLVESIEVRVTNVDVVVTDRQGHPVAGLTKDDFELYENRKPQPITNFYEVRPPAASEASVAIAPATPNATPAVAAAPEPPQDLRRRRVIFFIDEYSANPIRRNQVLRSMIAQLDALMKPGDEAMLVSWNRSMHIIEPFTNDREHMRKALARLEERGGGGPNLDAGKEILKSRVTSLVDEVRMKRKTAAQALGEAFDYVRAYSMELYAIQQNLAQSMGVALTTLAGVDGKKVMVFAGEHMPAHPGAEMFGWAEQQFQSVGLMSTGAAEREGNKISLTLAFESVAKQANAAGVTMYMLDSADPLRGVLPSSESNEVADPVTSFVDFTNTAQTFQAIAQLTGGVALTQSSNFDAALQTVARDLEAYYSLGYRPADEKREGDRNITVKVKNPAYRVRSRRTYVSKSGEQQTSERVVANIFAATSKNDIELRLDPGQPVGSGFHKWRVPVRVTIPSVFTLLPDGDQLAGGFTVFVAVGDDDGAMSSVTKRSQSLKIPAASEAAFRRRPITFDMQVEVNKGEHVLSVGVVDQLTNATGFARTKIWGR